MQEKIDKALEGLKDFQRSTVDYVYDLLYRTGNAEGRKRDKMLIADEVGLGKTVVAKGLIALAYRKYLTRRGKETFNVVYVCSNQALAAQNLTKLNFTDDRRVIDYSKGDDRLTALAYKPPEPKAGLPSIRIKAFTPATSFDDRSHAGRADERVLLYRLLHDYEDFAPHANSLKWMLKVSQKIKEETWEWRIKTGDGERALRPDLKKRFRAALEADVVGPEDEQLADAFAEIGLTQSVKYWTLLRKLCSELPIRKNNYQQYKFCKRLVSSLRFRLSKICAEFLEADVFILDEFQRYKQLLENATEEDDARPAIQLAKLIFNSQGSKTLMLSATPFKPYTNDFDALNGEVHYEEFKTVLAFLLKEKSKAFWEDYEEDRKRLFSFLRHPKELGERMEAALALKEKLEGLYRQGMVRTEKLMASKDKDSLIRQVFSEPVKVQPEDIRDFVEIDRVTREVEKRSKKPLATPIEYVKSCPFPWSFLDGYAHKTALIGAAKKDPQLLRILKKSPNAWLNLDRINRYEALLPVRGKLMPNGKLRQLLEQTVHNGGWKFLWVPPSLPYYRFTGAFEGGEEFSKTLIFSSWKMVPRMVSTLVSYEAERLCIGALAKGSTEKAQDRDPVYYFQKDRFPRPQFTFKVENDLSPQQMNNFILAYPSTFLARRFDPLTAVGQDLDPSEIIRLWKSELIDEFTRLDLNGQVSGKGSEWRRWFWIAPLLLDREGARDTDHSWLAKEADRSHFSADLADPEEGKAESKGWLEHLRLAADLVLGKAPIDVPRLTLAQIETVCEHLAELALGSPAVCALRALERQFSPGLAANPDAEADTADKDTFDPHPGLLAPKARDIGYAFLRLFNKPESIAILRRTGGSRDEEYWRKVLHYSIGGNLQSMLDEFAYMLVHSDNRNSAIKLRNHIIDVLSIKTARADVDGLKEFMEGLSGKSKRRKKSIRTHYAAEFGLQKLDTARGSDRQVHIREAFNSPFRPFVLATTSIGQEGLDFHFYCRRIFHWNLPSNPIDFEQREGRIHRYKGFVIRKKLAVRYGAGLDSLKAKDPWEALFSLASREKSEAQFQCDLVPFWHTDSTPEIQIDRIVPIYPLSRDIEKFKKLKAVLAHYRLTFGQPRQEELVETLSGFGFSEEQMKDMEKLIIDLSPIRFLEKEKTREALEIPFKQTAL